MSSRTQLPWFRILVEGAVIVASILLALTADAWWDGVQDRRVEQTILRGLHDDFEATLTVIAENRRAQEARAATADELLSYGGDRRTLISAARADTLLASILPGSPFVPVDPTLSALLTSDGLGAISDADLRAHLAGWPPLVAVVLQNEQENLAQLLNHFLPYLYDRVPIRVLDAIGSPESGTQVSAFVRDARDLLADIRFENHVNDVLFYARSKAAALQRAEEQAQAALVMIQEELRD